MNYIITGGAGNISAPLTKNLLAAGKRVTVIGRNADHLKDLTQAGATAFSSRQHPISAAPWCTLHHHL